MVEELLEHVEAYGEAAYRVDFRRLGKWPYINIPVPDEVLEAEEKFGPLVNRSPGQRRRQQKRKAERENAETGKASGTDEEARARPRKPASRDASTGRTPTQRPPHQRPSTQRSGSGRRRRRRRARMATLALTLLICVFHSEGLKRFAEALPRAPEFNETHPAAAVGHAYAQGSVWITGAAGIWHDYMTRLGAEELRGSLLSAVESLNTAAITVLYGIAKRPEPERLVVEGPELRGPVD